MSPDGDSIVMLLDFKKSATAAGEDSTDDEGVGVSTSIYIKSHWDKGGFNEKF